MSPTDRPAASPPRRHVLHRAVRSALAAYVIFRRSARNRESGLILGCAAMAVPVGLLVVGLREAVLLLHQLNFALPPDNYLSAQLHLAAGRAVLVPLLGGVALGLGGYLVRRFRPSEIVDPIEANAIFGGRMSIRDSIRLTMSTLVSNASGASVGMEAGYSQIGAAILSWFGHHLGLRREDRRIFVTAGAAAAIAAAFNAPLAGAFYGFELILGSYTSRALAPVVVAGLIGAVVSRTIGTELPLFETTGSFQIVAWIYPLFALLGIAAAGFGILTMKSATWVERGLRAMPLPEWSRPAAGGLWLGLIALASPQVLGSGHGAVQFHLDNQWPLYLVVLLLLGKLMASAVSLGAGFRGGLFSSSLFLGCLLGDAMAQAAAYLDPALAADRVLFMLVGMGSVAAAIIGAPLTMVFLVLEATGDFPISIAVTVGVITAATIVRLGFGYSFSTWRFHLRGLPLRGAYDIGWLVQLTVGRLMRADAKTVPANMPLLRLQEAIPIGSTKRVFAVDNLGRYLGMIDVATIHDPDLVDAATGLVAADLAQGREQYLLPEDNIRTALGRFDEAAIESMPVLQSADEPIVVGYLSEDYALRRYTQELERRRSDDLGAPDLYPSARLKS